MCKHDVEVFEAEDFVAVTPDVHPADVCKDPWDEIEPCDVCGEGDAVVMGRLGRLNWYRCADCGSEFCRHAW